MTTLAEAYRPRRFEEVLGQDGTRWVMRALLTTMEAGRRFPSSVLLTGPSGTGKTSLSRILARALNCSAPTQGEPCLTCPSCLQSLEGSHPSVIEVDSANYAKADEVRGLVAAVGVAHPFKHLCIIMDEAHAMSRQAWDVLLRTLESDPDQVTFIFCTTSPEKLRPEVLSRVYRFDLSPPKESEVADRVVQAAAACGRTIELSIAYELAERGHGNVRTSLQMLEKVLVHPDADVTAVLGRSGFGVDLLEAAVRRDRTGGVRILDEAWARYGNTADVYADWVGALEQLLMVKCDAPTTDNPVTLDRLRDLCSAYHETMIAAGLETLADWARRGGRRGSLSFAWAAFLKALNGPTAVDGLAAGAMRRQTRKATQADLSGFTL